MVSQAFSVVLVMLLFASIPAADRNETCAATERRPTNVPDSEAVDVNAMQRRLQQTTQSVADYWRSDKDEDNNQNKGKFYTELELKKLIADAVALDARKPSERAVSNSDKKHTVLEDYFDVVRDTLTGTALKTPSVKPAPGSNDLAALPYDAEKRHTGGDWCYYCYTMAGTSRVQNVKDLMKSTLEDGVPGDFLEAGTWRGGSSIMARVVQKQMDNVGDRRTYVCDSFSGLPKASTGQDGNHWSKMHFLEVSKEEVQDNFRSFNALDKNVQFVKGYFMHSMPPLRAQLKKEGRKLAVLRGDGDMYESYMDILYNLYDLIPVGGYFICDDCPTITVAQDAIMDFRKQHGITEEIHSVKRSAMGTYWRKQHDTPVNYTKYLEWNATRHPAARWAAAGLPPWAALELASRA